MKNSKKQDYFSRLQRRDFIVPDELQGKTVGDIIESASYHKELGKVIKGELRLLNEWRKSISHKKRYIVERVDELDLLTPKAFAKAYGEVLDKRSQYPVAIRMYIRRIGERAYALNAENLICKANPDMAELRKTAMAETKKKAA